MTSRVFFEEADRPPPSYFENELDETKPLKKVPFQTPEPSTWLKAPEFVPRSKLLADAFGDSPQISNFAPPTSQQPIPLVDPPNFVPYSPVFPFPPLAEMPLPPPMPLSGIPAGYTANMTTINPANGPPIAAILLRKKRKRRSKHATNSMIMNTTHSTSPCSSHPSDPNGDASDSDEFLYEVPPRSLIAVAKERVTGTTNEKLQELDNEINGNTMTSSMVLKRLVDHTYMSDGTTDRTLADEIQEINFRPTITKMGYPQIDCNPSPFIQMATMDSKNKKVKSALIDKEALKAYLDEEEQEEDFIEGLNLRVNNFDTCDDLTLSDVEMPSRFQQIQEVIRKNTIVYSNELKAPERVCCSIM
ncbi:unnamed protein product [Caenorhabditis bovis]|uniref:Uncharacterized protein n=1 Tax=Caenorhabditis bovis TaxID=2654633 RepID=A0A8S1F7Q4_9PELO|nr:unnamed protein product [Caenorhabditis bovis]